MIAARYEPTMNKIQNRQKPNTRIIAKLKAFSIKCVAKTETCCLCVARTIGFSRELLDSGATCNNVGTAPASAPDERK